MINKSEIDESEFNNQLKELFPENFVENNIDIASKEDEIQDLLITLSIEDISSIKDDTKRKSRLQDTSQSFYKIYSTGYRHLYSRAFQTIKEINDKSTKSTELSESTTLLANLSSLYTYIKEYEKGTKWDTTASCCRKLYDHVNLEIYRLNNLDNKIQEAYNQADKLRKQIDSMIKSSSDSQQELKRRHLHLSKGMDKINDRLNDFNTQSITILGIFAAIVFAFTGGFSILGDAFNGINTTYSFRYVFTLIFLSFSLFNIIIGLVYSIAKITNKPLAIKCQYADICSCENHNKDNKRCCVFLKILRKYPMVFWINAVLVVCLAISIILFVFGLLK
jgi:regulator of replication initiation timing